jgi:hypothetical protein
MTSLIRPLAPTVFAVLATAGALDAGSRPQVEIAARARGAERVVVAQVAGVDARFERNRFGDELIVSRVVLQVQETLKGRPLRAVSLDLEGGTVGDVTLHVSDLPALAPGDRAVFFLDRGRADAHVPHLRGQGILRLDDTDGVEGSTLTLEAIRQMVQEVR